MLCVFCLFLDGVVCASVSRARVCTVYVWWLHMSYQLDCAIFAEKFGY